MVCRFDRRGRLLLVAGVLVAVTGAALAKPAAGDRKKKQPASSVRFIDAPSAESAAARQARLKRECRGRPNAGACLGMTGRD